MPNGTRPIFFQSIVLKDNKFISACGYPEIGCQSDMVPESL